MEHKLNIAQRATQLRHALYWQKVSTAAYQLLALVGWSAFVVSLVVGAS